MTSTFNQGKSDSQRDGSVVPGSTSSGNNPISSSQLTGAAAEEIHVDPGFADYADENEPTIISQRPVVPPQNFPLAMPLEELAAVLEGKQLDHFAVEKMIGGGGMGAVFRGRDLRLDRTVAIKVIPASKRDPETLRRFRLEAQAAARLDHPNIARVYYVGESERWNYIVFEFVDGVNIRDLVVMQGPLSVDDAVFYTRQVAEALQHAHERNVVHRDIKPSNILVTANGIVKVVDMGLARTTALEQSTADVTASGVTLGTFDYISPEQARNPRDADVRSDLYSLGCSLFFMLTGQPPFSEGTVLQKLLKHGSVPPPDPRGWRDDLSDEVHAILMKLMAKQPHERYQTPAELINDLLLLAEVEDLPRSQLPGTMMFTPTVAQKTLLEANLPWLVAVSFLLGSTLWLQSLQALSGGFSLPELNSGRFSETVSIDRQAADSELSSTGQSLPPTPTLDAGSPQNGLGDQDPTVDFSQDAEASVARIVVSQFRPADVNGQRWASTLDEALDLANQIDASEIEVRGRVELIRPVALVMPVNIVGRVGTEPQLVVSPQLTEQLSDWQSAIQIVDTRLEMEGLDVQMSGVVPAGKSIGLWGLHRSADLLISNVRVTLAISGADAGVYSVLADEAAIDAGPVAAEDLYSSSVELLDGCLVRGMGSLIGLRVDLQRGHRFGASVLDSLIAVSGMAIVIENSPSSFGSQRERSIRMFCEASTFYSAEGFARLQYRDFDQPILSLNRSSESCVYASRRGAAHLSIRGVGTESVLSSLDRFLLRGSNNAYDARIDSLCRCFDRDEAEIFSFGFNDAAQNGWFEERGNERQVRWVSPPDPMLDLGEVDFEDFRIVEDRFLPGFRSD